MKRNIIVMMLFAFLNSFIVAQEYSIVKSFPFGQPWAYYEKWDINEGSQPSVGSLTFITNNSVLSIDNARNLTVYNDEWIPVYTTTANAIRFTGKYWIEFYYVDTEIKVTISDFINHKSIKYLINITDDLRNIPNSFGYCYLSGNCLFFSSYEGYLVSWELLPEKKTLYRDIEATKVWLADGNAERLGIQKIGNQFYFGDFSTGGSAPLSYKNWKNYLFPEGEFSNLTQMPGSYIGTDSKGLSYYLMQYPLISLKGGPVTTLDPFPFALAILDTWTRKVYFRKYPAGTWDPPRRMNPSGSKYPEVIITKSWSVHPSGEIYFMDADTKKQEYQLKKLHNNWWKEIGADNRQIARIENNYTPLRLEASLNAGVNGYNYEQEFIWILEESTKKENISGKSVTWLRVRKLDGREGWLLSSEVYYD